MFLTDALPRLWIGLVASMLIGLLAYRRGSLTESGLLGTVIVGTTIFGFGGPAAGLTLIAFFVSSSALSHFKATNMRKQRAAEMFEKGGQRDIGQVLANGGAAAIFAVLWAIDDSFKRSNANGLFTCSGGAFWLLAAMVGALATVNADTWATELGVLSKSAPRLITHLTQKVSPGTSGGITRTGTLAAIGGALFIGIVYFVLGISFPDYGSSFRGAVFADIGLARPAMTTCANVLPLAAPFAVVGGLLGSLFDSFLGATVQTMYYSEARQRETEKATEPDGTPNRHLRGWAWMNNDWVNFIASLFGALVAVLLSIAIFR